MLTPIHTLYLTAHATPKFIELIISNFYIFLSQEENRTALMRAAEEGHLNHLDIIALPLDCGTDSEATDKVMRYCPYVSNVACPYTYYNNNFSLF